MQIARGCQVQECAQVIEEPPCRVSCRDTHQRSMGQANSREAAFHTCPVRSCSRTRKVSRRMRLSASRRGVTVDGTKGQVTMAEPDHPFVRHRDPPAEGRRSDACPITQLLFRSGRGDRSVEFVGPGSSGLGWSLLMFVQPTEKVLHRRFRFNDGSSSKFSDPVPVL